jgi:Glycosyl hydrolases family 39
VSRPRVETHAATASIVRSGRDGIHERAGPNGLRDRRGPLRRIWASIGYDEINWTYTGRGKALYRTLRDLAEVPYHVRNHNAFTSGNGLSEPARGSTNVYQEAPDGTPVYDWTLVDRVYDTIAGAGFRPVIELGFLPRDLVPAEAQAASWSRDVGHESYEMDGLWKHPPRDYTRWEELCARFVDHLVGGGASGERRLRRKSVDWSRLPFAHPAAPGHDATRRALSNRGAPDQRVAGARSLMPTAMAAMPS